MRIFLSLVMLVFSVLVANAGQNVTNFPNGLCVGSETEEQSASVNISTGSVYIVGTLEVARYTQFNGSVAVNGNFHQSGLSVEDVGTQLNIGLSTTIVVNNPIMVIGCNVTTTSVATPFISTNVATYPEGTYVTLVGSGSVLTLQDYGTFTGSRLELGANTRVMNAGDILKLQLVRYTSNTAGKFGYYWKEIVYKAFDQSITAEDITTEDDVSVGDDLTAQGNITSVSSMTSLGSFNCARIEGQLTVTSSATYSQVNSNVQVNISSGLIFTGQSTMRLSYSLWDDSGTLTMSTATVHIINKTLPASFILPAANGNAGLVLKFIVAGAIANGVHTLDGNASENIDGSGTYTEMNAQYDSVSVFCDGDEWFTIDANGNPSP